MVSSRVARMETRLYMGGSRARLPSRNRINAPGLSGYFLFSFFIFFFFFCSFSPVASTRASTATFRRSGGMEAEGRRYRRRVSSTGQPLWDLQNLIRPYEKRPSTGPISRRSAPATELPGLTNILQRKLRKLLEERDQTVIASIFPQPRTPPFLLSQRRPARNREGERERQREREREREREEPRLIDLLTG